MTVTIVEGLQAALLEFCREPRPDILGPDEGTIIDLCNSLYVRLEFKRRKLITNHASKDDPAQNELGGLLHFLGLLSDRGVLDRVLSEENAESLKTIMRGIREMGLVEAGLRKKDMAVFLKHSGDTDLLLDREQAIKDAAARKDA